MTYEEIVEKLKNVYGKAKADKIEGHIAVQFDIVGEGEGALYVEVTDGVIDVQPFEYYDHNALVRTTADVLMDIAAGKLDVESAYNDQKLWVEGDLGAALLLKNIDVKKTPVDKTLEKKVSAKKDAVKKTPARKKNIAKVSTKKTTK